MSMPDIKNMSGDELHNYLCFLYLSKLAPFAPNFLEPYIVRDPFNAFDSNRKYADEYNILWTHIDNEVIMRQLKEEGAFDFINALFFNDNQILDKTYERIEPVLQAHRPANPSLSQLIADDLNPKKKTHLPSATSPTAYKTIKPHETEARLTRLMRTLFSRNVKTLHETNIPTVRDVHLNKTSIVTELRIGGPQWHNNQARGSPAYEAWLDARKELKKRQDLEKHQDVDVHEEADVEFVVYFNNLKRQSDSSLVSERNNEARMTRALEALEERHDNIAVITLSADDALMSKHAFKHRREAYSVSETMSLFKSVVREDETTLKQYPVDFHISKKFRIKLHDNTFPEYINRTDDLKLIHFNLKMEELLENSFKAVGIDPTDSNLRISEAERQAVWFHFNKYELPNYIIQTLNPSVYNFTCKDAIDRGGVSSAYYNLMRCLNGKIPFSKDDFDAILQAAPAMVKGRGMNHHLHLIWNAVDAYVNAHFNELVTDKKHAWLIYWRDMHCPHERVEHVLIERLKQLKQLPVDKSHGESFEELIAELNLNKHASGQRLMLEAVSFTEKMIRGHAAKTDEGSFQELIQDMERHPKNDALKIMAGLLKQLVGYLFYLPTLGYSKSLITEGEKTTAAGISGKRELQAKFSAFKIGFFHSHPAPNNTANPEQEKTSTPDKP